MSWCTAANPIRRRPARPGGFTLVELMAVLVITGVMAAVAVPVVSNLADTRAAAFIRLLQRDLVYARGRAIATGTPHRLQVNALSSSYDVRAVSGVAAAIDTGTVITRLGGGPHVQRYNTGEFAGVSIDDFDEPQVTFDWTGAPYWLGGVPGTVSGTPWFRLNRGPWVRIEAHTGYVRIME